MKTTSSGPLIMLGGMGLQPDLAPAWKELLEPLSGSAARMAIVPMTPAAHRPILEQRISLAEKIFSSLGMTTQTVQGHNRHLPTLSEADCVFVMANANLAASFYDTIHHLHSAGMAMIATASVAAALGEHTFAPVKPYPAMIEALDFDLLPGAGMLPGAAILPYFDRFPNGLLSKLETLFPPETPLIGIDEQAMLVSGIDGWHVAGFGSVTILGHNEVTLVSETGTDIPNQLLMSLRR